ncbi:Putative exodeoxyribonuclease 8, PDDEXK-like domain containing protein [uncultured Caudovirales phage]|uniref:Exodeoxyribonuclease 8, PDDEXK-like domain containing protein n=1 Tax=uncultured Caudovirales phage TaxID=2100421 RepID=A0A6J5Q956_9CAUD|nr:Putative exodeoxyribonuclease 8, PDDEXK-like domain containing protein [uncultured Caudovirales phage]
MVSDERRNCKAWKEAAAENPGKTLIRPRHEKELLRWHDAVMRNKEARQIIESGFPELTVHLDHESGVACKARFDLFCGSTGGVFDLKTTRKDDRQGFEWQAEDLLYHVSAGFYDLHREGLGIYSAPYRYIVVTKGNPSYCWVFPISYTLMSAGRGMALEGLRRIAQCRRNEQEVIARGGDPMDCWPDYIETNQGDEMVPRVGTASRLGLLSGEERGWNQ